MHIIVCILIVYQFVDVVTVEISSNDLIHHLRCLQNTKFCCDTDFCFPNTLKSKTNVSVCRTSDNQFSKVGHGGSVCGLSDASVKVLFSTVDSTYLEPRNQPPFTC